MYLRGGHEDAPKRRRPCGCAVCTKDHDPEQATIHTANKKVGHEYGCECRECMAEKNSVMDLRAKHGCKLVDICDKARWANTVYMRYCERMDLLDAPAVYLQIAEIGDNVEAQINADARNAAEQDG